MWTRKLLKDNAKIAFKRNYWICVVVSLIALILGASTNGSTWEYQFDEDNYGSVQSILGFETDSDRYDDYDYYNDEDFDFRQDIAIPFTFAPYILMLLVIVMLAAFVFVILVTNVVKVGHKRFYMENREHKTKIGQLFYSFSGGRYGNTVWTMFCMDLYRLGWTLLFIIPGIIKGFSYMMVPYIMAENPEISKNRAFQISMSMMDGHKWEAFVLGLSFIGWQFVSAFTFGIAGIFWVTPYQDATYAEFYAAIKAEAFQRGITDSSELPGFAYPEFSEQAPEF